MMDDAMRDYLLSFDGDEATTAARVMTALAAFQGVENDFVRVPITWGAITFHGWVAREKLTDFQRAGLTQDGAT